MYIYIYICIKHRQKQSTIYQTSIKNQSKINQKELGKITSDSFEVIFPSSEVFFPSSEVIFPKGKNHFRAGKNTSELGKITAEAA